MSKCFVCKVDWLNDFLTGLYMRDKVFCQSCYI